MPPEKEVLKVHQALVLLEEMENLVSQAGRVQEAQTVVREL